MKVLVLAAGYATRLYPLTKEYPKPLLCVANRPIIDYIIRKLDNIKAIDEIFVVTNSKFMPYFKKWKQQVVSKKRIMLVDDLTRSLRDRRGAIGDMDFAINKMKIKDDLLVIGGDNLFDSNLSSFLFFARRLQKHPVIGVFDMKRKTEASKYGVIKIDKKCRITDFKEKPQNPDSALVAMCLYYFPKQLLKLVRKYTAIKKNKHDATGFYIDWLRKEVPVYGFVFNGRWFDIGDHKFYQKAEESF